MPRWFAQGYRGQGVKVAILDSGFRGYRRFLGKGLPKTVRTRSFRIDRDLEARDSQHGILCAEVVHAIAPDAELLFATWEPGSPRAFLETLTTPVTYDARNAEELLASSDVGACPPLESYVEKLVEYVQERVRQRRATKKADAEVEDPLAG